MVSDVIKYLKGEDVAKKKKRELWIIQFGNIDRSRDATVAYESREEAVEIAADFARDQAKIELEQIEWDPGDEAPKKLKEILELLKQGKKEDAIVEWLDYQGDYDPREKIAIGPSGYVSDSPGDFPLAAK